MARTADTPPLPRTRAAAVADRLREDILAGLHPAGAQLRQDAVAAAHGVSRIPVREALLQLEAEGFVRIAPHRGAVVAPVPPDEVEDVFDLRAMLEPRLLRRAVPLLAAEDFAALDALQREFSEAIDRRDTARWGQLNADFHARLYAPAPLPRTQAIVAQLLQASDRHTRLQLSTPSAMDRARREHAELVALARAGEAARAARRLAAHIEGVRAGLLAVLASGGGGR